MLAALALAAFPACPASASGSDAMHGARYALQYRVDNWEMFTNVKVDCVTFELAEAPDDGDATQYLMHGFMTGWYGHEYLLGDVRVGYISDSETLILYPQQEVMNREGITWSIYNLTEDESFDDNRPLLRLDPSSPHGDWRLVNNVSTPAGSYYSGGLMLASDAGQVPDTEETEFRTLYMFRDLSLHHYNGSMEYDFADRYGRQYHNEAVVHTWVDGSNLFVRNFSNVGFDYDVFFSIDPQARTVTAKGQVLLDDPDMLGECVLGAADSNGAPLAGIDERHTLTGTFTQKETDGHVETVIDFPVWGAFNERGYNFFNPTSGTTLYVGYDILNPPASIGAPEVSPAETDAPAEYYSLQGVRMAHPSAGQLCIERRGSQVRKIIAK